MAILTLQKRARSLGRIRIGQVVPTQSGKTRPAKLDRFRLTSPSKPLLDKAASLYGGTVQEWTPQGGGAKQWEVLTDSKRIPIMVPPQPVSQFLETWAGGICVHRCDGYTEMLSGETCDPDDPRHIEARPTTRLNVVLRDVEGIGVWRLETKGWNAAMELPDAAEFLAQAGGYVNGWLSLEERVSKTVVDGKPQTRRFMVPIIEIDVTPAELMAGRGRVATPELAGPVPQTPAIAGPQGEGRPAIAGPDPYAPWFERLEDAASLDDCTVIWGEMVQAVLVGPKATPSPRADEFVAAFKERAHQIQAAKAPQPDAEGVYEADVVPDSTAPTAGEEEATVVWTKVLEAAAEHGMSLPQVQDDFVARMGDLTPESASASELKAYLQLLVTGEEPAA
ncbi:hypothetical protein [Nocardioides speluncae]|uniref:recombination directionality factor n=1 Tax=Nocardioides speluncae TaxID=2670337 RepID=UPI000D69EFFA|nr:hypothetical protein [Nocardioides speluncae]